MRNFLLATLICSAAGFRMAHLCAAVNPAGTRQGSIAMKQADVGPVSALPLPSIYALGYAALIYLQSEDFVKSQAVAEWAAAGMPIDDTFPVKTFLGDGLLVGFSLLQLGKMAGIGKTDYYGDLEGLDVGSLSSDAAEWALAGEVPTQSKDGSYAVATFAGGCFWGTELHYQRLPGVVATCVGYTQGRVEKPSYGQVCGGYTGHTEGIMLTYDPDVVSYGELCDLLFRTIDSTALNRVGNDIGTQHTGMGSTQIATSRRSRPRRPWSARPRSSEAAGWSLRSSAPPSSGRPRGTTNASCKRAGRVRTRSATCPCAATDDSRGAVCEWRDVRDEA
jgi:hypothetical protein